MKFTTAAVTLLPLFGLAAGQPSRYNHQGGGSKRYDVLFMNRPSHASAERDVVPAVFVNAAGTPTSTGLVASNVNAVTTSTPLNAQAAAATPTAQMQGGSGGGWSTQNGVTYSPYTDSGYCKTQDQVTKDIRAFAPSYGTIRLYGVDCNQVAAVTQALIETNNKNRLFLGLFDLDTIHADVGTMASCFGQDWSRVDTISVGNELVNSGQKTVAQVLAAMTLARSELKGRGYTGHVVTVDTFNAVLAAPSLCTESDYCAVNMHPFFDAYTSAEDAGTFMTKQLARVRSAIGGATARVVVTETGWPWKGDANGAAQPGVRQQSLAIQAIRAVFNSTPTEVFLFSAFNDMWKKALPATFNAEQYWGIGKGPSQ